MSEQPCGEVREFYGIMYWCVLPKGHSEPHYADTPNGALGWPVAESSMEHDA